MYIDFRFICTNCPHIYCVMSLILKDHSHFSSGIYFSG